MDIPSKIMEKARSLLKSWKADSYFFGDKAMEHTGALAARHGKTVLMVANSSAWMAGAVKSVQKSLNDVGLATAGSAEGCRPNSPYNDVFRIQRKIVETAPYVIVAVGGGSTIDGVKAAAVLAAFEGTGNNVDPYFGMGTVSTAIKRTGKRPVAVVAVQCASGSGAHLTKYSNITNPATHQKKLIIDDAIVPPAAVFDYGVTVSASRDLTLDGAFDGIAHLMEVYFGARPETIDKIEPVALTGLELIAAAVPAAVQSPADAGARTGLGLGTDLGGYAIMIGGTNGPHLNSFSLVGVMPHGRACALLLPYYTVFFSRAIGRQLAHVAPILQKYGYMTGPMVDGLSVAAGLQELARRVGFPTGLTEAAGFTESHVDRILRAARDPALASKLANMPVPLSADQVEERMGPILRAAVRGDLKLVQPA